jgi:hypothetical protein
MASPIIKTHTPFLSSLRFTFLHIPLYGLQHVLEKLGRCWRKRRVTLPEAARGSGCLGRKELGKDVQIRFA